MGRALFRVQSVQRLKLVLSPVHPSLCCPILLILFLYSWRWTDRDKHTPRGQHRLQSWEQSRGPSRTFLHLGPWLISARPHGSSWLEKDFCLMVIVMWHSAYYNGSRVVSGWSRGATRGAMELLFPPDTVWYLAKLGKHIPIRNMMHCSGFCLWLLPVRISYFCSFVKVEADPTVWLHWNFNLIENVPR